MFIISVSVIVCTNRNDRYQDFIDGVNSLLSQTYRDTEIIVVVDGNKELYKRIVEYHKSNLNTNLKILLNQENLGLSESRNRGIKEAKGDIIAFFDDDAVADKDWINELVKMYIEHDAIAVGGKLLPKWIAKKPNFLPEEYYWLIGATHKGFPEKITEVRNTFGSNISFKANVIKALGGFKREMGIKEGKRGFLQGEEVELCARMRHKFGRGVIYNPRAVVHHKIFDYRIKLQFLLKRAFWQGYSKKAMKKLVRDSMYEERGFLKNLVVKSVPELLKKRELKKLIFILICTIAIGSGYLYGFVQRGK